jgi:hypothetical protein
MKYAFSQKTWDWFYGNTDKRFVGWHNKEKDFIGKFAFKNHHAQFSGNGIHPIVFVHRNGCVCFGDWGNWHQNQTVYNTKLMTDADIIETIAGVFVVNRKDNFDLFYRSCDEYVQHLWDQYIKDTNKEPK